MTEVLQVRGTIRRPLEARSEPGWAELCDALCELLDGADPAQRVTGLRPLKRKVYRLEFEPGAPCRSLVVKRLEPAIAQRSRLVAERWLPALGLDDRCARLLGVAADRTGDSVWHIYEDLGDGTLAARPDADRVKATVDLIADLHSSAARHTILPDVRRYGSDLGMPYFTSNVRDAIAALEALRDCGIKTPPEHAGLPERLLEPQPVRDHDLRGEHAGHEPTHERDPERADHGRSRADRRARLMLPRRSGCSRPRAGRARGPAY